MHRFLARQSGGRRRRSLLQDGPLPGVAASLFEVDSTPPCIEIMASPPGYVARGDVEFEFKADDKGAVFECSLLREDDSANGAPCLVCVGGVPVGLLAPLPTNCPCFHHPHPRQ